MRTKTDFIGFQRRRAQTERPLKPGSGGVCRPWFAYENRFHCLSEEAYANREAPDAGFERGQPTKFALENRIHWLSREASANRRSRPAGFRRVQTLKFALESRIHWLSWEASANRGSLQVGERMKARQPDLQKKQKTLNRRTEASADSKFFHYILHSIYKEETYSFSPKAKRRMVRPTPSSSLLSAT